MKVEISNNGVSRVWREDGYVFKQQPKHLAQNEYWGLRRMYFSGYVPEVWMHAIDVVKMEDLGESEPVRDREKFLSHLPRILSELRNAGIRHGDLTNKALIVKDDKPFVIDFAESRLWDDPRPDKREGGDELRLTKTMLKMAQ